MKAKTKPSSTTIDSSYLEDCPASSELDHALKRLFWMKIHVLAMILFFCGLIGLLIWFVTHKDTHAMLFWWGFMTAILCVKINTWLEAKSSQNIPDQQPDGKTKY